MFACLLALPAGASMAAQKASISSSLSDRLGPVIGASAVEKGTVHGTCTLDTVYESAP